MTSEILFLHGAGISDKNRTKYLQDILLNNEIKSYSFDFTGAGGDKSKMAKSSLKKRLEQAEDAIKQFDLKEPLTLCGSSMGAYIAIKLLENYTVENLILFCPGLYTTEAYDVLFTDQFSEIIRKKDSWKESDAFDILNTFKGKLLLFIGDHDEVIPTELVYKVKKSLGNTQSKEIIYIPDAPHAIHPWLSQNEEWKQKVAHKIIELI